MNSVASSIRVFAAAKPAAKKPAAKKPAAKGAVQKNKWLGGEGGFDESKWYGADRKLYLPGGLLDPAEVPAYLDGSLAGDYGYDPLSLGKSPEQVEKYREFELLHGRWAMLGALGAILPEAINAFGGNVPGAVWWQTGAVQLAGDNLTYAGSIPTLPLPVNLAITVGAFAVLEGWRKSGEEVKGMPAIFPNGPAAEPLYPGGKFDPLGLGNDPVALAELKARWLGFPLFHALSTAGFPTGTFTSSFLSLIYPSDECSQVKEIKNGRLAMVSMLGFAVQAAVTQEGPFDNWVKHLADPFGYNLLTILSVDRAPTL